MLGIASQENFNRCVVLRETLANVYGPPEGLTENDGHENDGPSKLQDMKLQDMKKTDQVAGHENAGHENDGPSSMA